MWQVPPGKTVPLIQKPMARDTLDLKKARPGHGRCDRIRWVAGLTCVYLRLWDADPNWHQLKSTVSYFWNYDCASNGSWSGPTTFRYRGPMKASRSSRILEPPNFGIPNCGASEPDIPTWHPRQPRIIPYSQVLTIHINSSKIWQVSCKHCAQAAYWVWRANWHNMLGHMLVLQMHRCHRFQDWCHVCSLRFAIATGCEEKWFTWEPLNPLPGRLRQGYLLPGSLDHRMLGRLVKIQGDFAGVVWFSWMKWELLNRKFWILMTNFFWWPVMAIHGLANIILVAPGTDPKTLVLPGGRDGRVDMHHTHPLIH